MTIPHLSEGTGAPRLAHKRVVIVDDHRLSSNALADSLGVRGIQVVAVEHNGSDGYRACIHHRPDALLVDFDLGLGPTGADLAISVRGEQPGLGILMFTAYEEPKLLSGSFPSLPPTVVYLVKQHVHDVDEVVQALDWSIDAASSKKLPPDRVHHFPLTQAQAQILRLVAKGMSNQAIAEELVVSVPTVASGIRRLAKKFGISHRSESNVRVQLTQKFYNYVGFQREQD